MGLNWNFQKGVGDLNHKTFCVGDLNHKTFCVGGGGGGGGGGGESFSPDTCLPVMYELKCPFLKIIKYFSSVIM